MISNIQGGTAPAEAVDLIKTTPLKASIAGDETVTSTLQPKESAAAAKDSQQNQTAGNEQQQKKLSKADVGTMTEALNSFMKNLNCNLEFKYYEKLDRLSIKMVDQKSQKVIKEFPPEDMMKTMIKTKEWLGAFLDKKA